MKPKIICRETLVSDSDVRRIMACHTYTLIVLFLCSSIFFPHVAAIHQEQENRIWMKTVETICDVLNDNEQLLDVMLSLFSSTKKQDVCEWVVTLLHGGVKYLGCRPYQDSQKEACMCQYEEKRDL